MPSPLLRKTASSVIGLSTDIELNNGVNMPLFGYGAYRLESDRVGERATLAAIDAGYRHIDTAIAYNNEEAIGRAVAESKIGRENIFITSKLFFEDQGLEETERALDGALARLKTDYLDLLLIHWPDDQRMAGCWEAMCKAVETGKLRAAGVSNFTVKRFETFDRLCSGLECSIDQVELHVGHQQRPLQDECAKRGIQLSGYCPLARGGMLEDSALLAIARKHGKSVPQVMIRWSLQMGFPTIPKSSSPDRIGANAQVFDFELDHEDLSKIDALDGAFEANKWRPDHEVFY